MGLISASITSRCWLSIFVLSKDTYDRQKSGEVQCGPCHPKAERRPKRARDFQGSVIFVMRPQKIYISFRFSEQIQHCLVLFQPLFSIRLGFLVPTDHAIFFTHSYTAGASSLLSQQSHCRKIRLNLGSRTSRAPCKLLRSIGPNLQD